jgi:hypothetical protein
MFYTPYPSLCGQFFQQRLGVFQIGSIEPLGEPPIDFSQHRARLATTPHPGEQPREAHRRAQFPCFRVHAAREGNRFVKIGLGRLRLIKFETQFATNPECLGTAYGFIGIKVDACSIVSRASPIAPA